MFIGFVVAYCGFIWFYLLQSILKFNVLELCFHGQPVGNDKKYFFIFLPLLQISEPNLVCT